MSAPFEGIEHLVEKQRAEIARLKEDNATLNKAVAVMAEWTDEQMCSRWDEHKTCNGPNPGCTQCIIDHFTREVNDEQD